jgi:hypothetical protein
MSLVLHKRLDGEPHRAALRGNCVCARKNNHHQRLSGLNHAPTVLTASCCTTPSTGARSSWNSRRGPDLRNSSDARPALYVGFGEIGHGGLAEASRSERSSASSAPIAAVRARGNWPSDGDVAHVFARAAARTLEQP